MKKKEKVFLFSDLPRFERDEVLFLWLSNMNFTPEQAFFWYKEILQGRARIRFEKIKVAECLTKQDKKNRKFLVKHNL